MLIFFIFLLVSLGVSVWIFSSEEWKSPVGNLVSPFVIMWIIFMVITLIVWIASYDRYLDARTFYDATKEQYSNSVVMYKNYAEIDLQSAAWTDLKYQGYQENIAVFIRELRNKIVKYNSNIISKRVMKVNPLFNWFIVAPDDDMLVIKMIDRRNE